MEILQEFVTTTTAENPWKEVIDSVKTSNELLNATWNMDENKHVWMKRRYWDKEGPPKAG